MKSYNITAFYSIAYTCLAMILLSMSGWLIFMMIYFVFGFVMAIRGNLKERIINGFVWIPALWISIYFEIKKGHENETAR